MKLKKLISVILVTLCLSSIAIAKEEKFEEDFKVEKAVSNERQIASEKESERDPSSVTPPAEIVAEEAPKPWLHKLDGASN